MLFCVTGRKMKFLIFVTLITYVLASPQAPPATNYGVPNGDSFNAGASFGGNAGGPGGSNAGNGGNGAGNGGNAFAGQLFQLVPVGGNGGQGTATGSFGGNAGQGTATGSFGGNAGQGTATGSFGGQSSGSGSFGVGGQGSASFGGASANAGKTVVTKDVYVHVPQPEDSEEFAGNKDGGAVQRKHYKIIFIKAPSVSTEQQLAAQSAAQTEEKTIVYVLVKKPDLTPSVEVDKSQNAANNKPEVYFIKYKSQREGGQGAGGQGFGNGNGNGGFGNGNAGGNGGFGNGNAGGNGDFGGSNTYVPPFTGGGSYQK